MSSYIEYVLAAYGIALVVYGGSVLLWHLRLRRYRAELAAEKPASKET